jgi:hypothetical protein
MCFRCQPGQYQPSSRSTSCIDCPIGTHQPSGGSISCLGETAPCDATAYAGSVAARCGNLGHQCAAETGQATSVADRTDVFCGDTNSCGMFIDCIKGRLASVGCEDDAKLTAGIQNRGHICDALKNNPGVCAANFEAARLGGARKCQ